MLNRIKFSLILSILTIVLCLSLGELFVRYFKTPLYPKDNELGWIFPHQERKGSGNKKILVIGDSFTQARGIVEDRTYYASFLPFASDLQVYGIGAYGTYQEYLLLKRVLQHFSPDIVLWQFSPNDFINNIPELERQFHSTLHMTDRPFYLGNEKSKFGYELFRDLKMIHFLSFSRLFMFLYEQWQMRHLEPPALSPEEAVRKSNSLEITSTILKKVRETLPSNAQLYFFTTETSLGLKDEFNHLIQANGLQIIPVAERLIEEKNKGKNILSDDHYHWNELGHQIVGNEILKFIRE